MKKKSNKHKTFHIVRRLLSYMTAYKFRLVVVCVCIFISSVTNVRATYYIEPAIDNYIVPLIGHQNPDLTGFFQILALMALLYLTSVTTLYLQNTIMVTISNDVMTRIRKQMFDKMLSYPVGYFDQTNNGVIMSYYTNDIDSLSDTLRKSFPVLVSSFVTIVTILFTIFTIDIYLSVVLVVCIILIALILKFLVGNKSRLFVKQQEFVGELNSYGEEMITGRTEVKCFKQEKKVQKKFEEISQGLFKYSSKSSFFANNMFEAIRGLTNIGYTIIAFCGCCLTLMGLSSVGAVGVFLQYYKNLISPVTQISKQVNNIFYSLAGAERIFKFLDKEPEIDDGTIRLINKDDKFYWRFFDGKLEECRGNIKFDHVNFAYVSNKLVLKDLCLDIKAGDTVAFVGSTGAGKTTIINLLSRFYEIESGSIYFDSVNINNIKKKDLRKAASVVLQETKLFSDSVQNNIKYGKLDAGFEEVKTAAKIANADYFIGNLPKGYDTYITNNGDILSEGEKQLLSIARASIAKSPVIVLDEATSSIDTRTESLIEKGLNALMEGKTVLVIAHRLSTIKNADTIIVLDHGHIVEAGSHQQLLDKKAYYYQLYSGSKKLE